MKIFSIGFESRDLRRLEKDLKEQAIVRLIDVRCFPEAESAGWAKGSNLSHLKGLTYRHEMVLAPTPDILKAYFEHGLPWEEYERQYFALMHTRRVEVSLDKGQFRESSCFICQEHKPERCHRRLALEYLAAKWPELQIVHL